MRVSSVGIRLLLIPEGRWCFARYKIDYTPRDSSNMIGPNLLVLFRNIWCPNAEPLVFHHALDLLAPTRRVGMGDDAERSRSRHTLR